MVYRLYTEDKNRKWITQLVAENFTGFNITRQTGYWQGKAEKSLCIEIIDGSNSADFKINRICRAICGYNKQDCVMLVKLSGNVQFISAGGVQNE